MMRGILNEFPTAQMFEVLLLRGVPTVIIHMPNGEEVTRIIPRDEADSLLASKGLAFP